MVKAKGSSTEMIFFENLILCFALESTDGSLSDTDKKRQCSDHWSLSNRLSDAICLANCRITLSAADQSRFVSEEN
jgi:hypothetical protein